MSPAVRVTERASYVLAKNPGIMTLDGTYTYVLREPGAARSIVVDPGPDDDAHLQAVLAEAGEVALVLFTHRHFDHTEAMQTFCALSGAPARAVDPVWCLGAEPLRGGEIITVDGLEVEVVLTPGHTDDSVSFRLLAEPSLLTGDTILGRGTTIVSHPDGQLGAYLDSLAHIREMVEEGLATRLLPAHGGVIDEAAAVVDFYLEHRTERLEQVRAAVAQGLTTPRAVVESVYADVDEVLWPAAERSVAAQLEYLLTNPT